jgi:predicted protein tyrosine phosphatase
MLKEQMLKDRNKFLSLILSLNYSSSIITDSSSYHDGDYNNHHDATNPLGRGSANVKSLSDICIDTIAKNFDGYDIYMMKDFLQILLIPEFIEKILLLTCKHRTQTDSNIECFTVDVVKRMYLSSAITNEMIVQCLCAKNEIISPSTAQVVDSWETIDVSTYLLNENDSDHPHHRIEIHELYFIENKLSKDTILMIRKHQFSLQKLCLYNVTFDDDYPYLSHIRSDPQNSRLKAKHFHRCLDIFRLFSVHELCSVSDVGYNYDYDDDYDDGRGSIFNNLAVLELYNCSWVDLRALEVWCHDIAHHRSYFSTGVNSEVVKIINDDTDTFIDRSDHQHIPHDKPCRRKSSYPSVLRRLKFINIYGYSALHQSFAVDSSSSGITDHHINGTLHPSCPQSDEVEHLVRLFESECSIKLTII